MKYDFLIVGCGLFGSTFAREAANAGLKCLIIDKRNHIGGNVYSKQISGIETHMYGPHIFNTNSKKVWDYVNSFTEFNSYRHQVKSFHDGFLYSFPLNLNTLEELYGSSDDQDLIKMINVMTGPPNTENAEKFAISVFGREIYTK
ncbi:MAG: NAD(P)-binding protein, partial [Candidatus Bathyarchaeota archaeon]|nr:NAD(P)-binding protein [Candidatus Bathyarchaeota archaeon]